MGRKSKPAAGGSIPRANAVPRLKLDELKTAGRPSPRQDILGDSHTSRLFGLQGTPSSSRSQALSPHPSGLPRPNSRGILSSGRGTTPRRYSYPLLGSFRSSQMSSARDGTPRTFSGRTNDSNGSARRQGSFEGSQGQGERADGLLTPKGSYRDILLTPRETPRMDHGSAVSSARRSTPRQPFLSGRQEHNPDGQLKTACFSGHYDHHEDGHNHPHQQQLSIQTDRSSNETVRHQISSLETSMQSQQISLVENITAVQHLGQWRDKLANDASALQAAVARAQAVAAARKAEIEELEMLTSALQSSLEISSAKEQSSAGSAAVTAARLSLLRVMQSAAETLRLPGVSSVLESEVQAVGSSARRSASLSCTSRSELSTSRFDTPTDSGRDIYEHHRDEDDGASSDDGSLESSNTGVVRGEGSARSRGGVQPQVQVQVHQEGGAPGTKVQRPGVTLPPLKLPGTIPALTTSSARVSPAAIARLHTIRTKLEVAEAILTTRVSGDTLI